MFKRLAISSDTAAGTFSYDATAKQVVSWLKQASGVTITAKKSERQTYAIKISDGQKFLSWLNGFQYLAKEKRGNTIAIYPTPGQKLANVFTLTLPASAATPLVGELVIRAPGY